MSASRALESFQRSVAGLRSVAGDCAAGLAAAIGAQLRELEQAASLPHGRWRGADAGERLVRLETFLRELTAQAEAASTALAEFDVMAWRAVGELLARPDARG